MTDLRRTLVLAISNLGYAWLLVMLAVTPSVPAAGVSLSDKLLHAFAYGGEALLLYWMLASLVRPFVASLAAWLGASSLGLFTEMLQGLTPQRTGDPADLLADMAGATAVVVAVTAVRRTLPILRSAWPRPGAPIR